MTELRTISLEEINIEQSGWVVQQFIAEFLKGKIDGFDSRVGMPASWGRCHPISNADCTYIEAALNPPITSVPWRPMPKPVPQSPVLNALQSQQGNSSKGSTVSPSADVVLQKYPRGYDQYGKCRIQYGPLMKTPVLYFELHKEKTKALSAILEGESVKLSYPYKRIGHTASIEKASICITNDPYAGLVVTAECENRYYRGIDKRMIRDLRGFMVSSGLNVSYEEQHVLIEELFFLYMLHADEAFSHYRVPDTYRVHQRTVLNDLLSYLSGIEFDGSDVAAVLNDIKEKNLPQHTFKKPEGIFKRENGQCYITFLGREYQIKDFKGMDFVQTVLCSPDDLTYVEIYLSARPEDQDAIALNSSVKFNQKGDVRITKKQMNSALKRLEIELEQAKQDNLKYEVEKLEDQIEEIQKYLCDFHRKVEVRDKARINVIDTVRTSMKRCKEYIERDLPELAEFFNTELIPEETPKGMTPKYIYRGKRQMKWTKE